GAPPEPVHDDPDPRAPRRPQLRAQQLAPAAQPVRAAVHDAHLPGRPDRRARLVLGAEVRAARGEPRNARARLRLGPPAGTRPRLGGGVRRAEPDRARVGARRRPQRLPDDALHRRRVLLIAPRARIRAQPTTTPAPARMVLAAVAVAARGGGGADRR